MKIIHSPLFLSEQATCPAHFIFLIRSHEKYLVRCTDHYLFMYYPPFLCYLVPSSSIIFSQTPLTPYSSLNVRDQHSNTYRTVGTIIDMCVLFLTFLDIKAKQKVMLLFELNLSVTGSTDKRRWTFASRTIKKRLDQLNNS